MSETEQVLPQPRDIDYDTFYEPVKEAGGFHTDEGRGVQEGLETNDATMAALQEIGVADGLIEYAAARWPYSHGGSEMDKEGVRFGILRRRSEDHTRKFTTPPSRTWNTLLVWGTEAGTDKRGRMEFEFQEPRWLAHMKADPYYSTNYTVDVGKLSILVDEQPCLVSKISPLPPIADK